MAELPKLARERLRNQARAGEHPDANLLSGFAEHNLTQPERAGVLDHLSRCAECRQIVALSAPEFEREAAVIRQAPERTRRSWWRSPIVHWSALTAAALVVLIAVGERMRLRESQSASAPAIVQHEGAQRSSAVTEPVPAPPEPKQAVESRQTPKTRPSAQTANRPRAMGSANAGEVSSTGKIATLGGPSAPAAAKTPSPAVTPPRGALPTKPSANAVTGQANRPMLESQNPQAKVAGAPLASDTIATEAAAPAGSTPERQTIFLSRSQPLARPAVLSPRWSVSAAGAVQRSLDGGRSWKDVAVADGVTFRAVASLGPDVWAGGSGGALFHSADGGDHWPRVRVQANNRELSGDIVRIEFSDSAHGVVFTSTGETWTTSDGGLSWRWQ